MEASGEADAVVVEKSKRALGKMEAVLGNPQTIKSLVNERCFTFQRTSSEKADKNRSALYNAFVVNGCVGLMQRWLEDDFAETPEEISQIVLEIITSGIKIIT